MDFHELVSAGLDSKLKCCVCQNYLSYFPIYLCSNGRSVCGRCDVPETTTAFRDEAFESLSQLITFPCRYNSEGCPETLVPRDIHIHETRCLYRVVPCAISKPQQCEWKGSLPNLTKHCQDEHSDAILKNGEFKFDLSASGECDNLLEYVDGLYVLTRKFDASNTTLSCALYTRHKKPLVTSVRVGVKKGNRTLLLDLETCTDQIVYSDLGLHPLVDSNEEEKSVVGHVDFNFANQQLDEETNSDLLSVLKCSKCNQFATTIGCVSNDGIKCENCHRRSIYEPNVSFKSLFKIMDMVKYPCKYRQFGCSFKGTRRISSHELLCQYQTENCPLHDFGLCSWKRLRKDANAHILKDHHDLVVSSGCTLAVLEGETKHFFIKYCGRLFHLVYGYNDYDHYFKWAVQSINCEENKFMHQVQIVDSNLKGKNLLMKQECSSSNELKAEFGDLDRCCYFKKNQLKDFRLPPTYRTIYPLRFKVHIMAS